MSTLKIDDYLRSKNLKVKYASGNNQAYTHCPFHKEANNKRGRLYVSLQEENYGAFICFVCGEKGGTKKLLDYWGDGDLLADAPDVEHSETLREIFEAATDYYHARLSENPEALKYLQKERGLTEETIAHFRLGWADGNLHRDLRSQFEPRHLKKTSLMHVDDGHYKDFFYECITIPYMVAGNAVSLRGKYLGGKYKGLPGDKGRLFNSDVLWTAEEAQVHEGEFDAMLAQQFGLDAVGVPGANIWKDEWTAYFADMKRVWVVFDPDPAGAEGANKIREKLGSKVRVVELPAENAAPADSDFTHYIVDEGHQLEDFKALKDRASGGLLLTIHDAYQESVELSNTPAIPLGFEGIDMMMDPPGIQLGQLAVVLAGTGVGKSVFIMNIMERVRRKLPDTKILLLSLELTKAQCFNVQRRIHSFYEMELDEDQQIGKTLDFWTPDKFRIIDKNRVSEGELRSALDDFEYSVGQKPDLVLLDYLGYYARSFKGEAYERSTAAIMGLKEIAKDYRVPIITPHQVNRGTDRGDEPDITKARDSGAIEESSDFVFTLWSSDTKVGTKPEDRTGLVNVRIGKSRNGGAGHRTPLQFAPLSLTLLPLEDPQKQMAKNEVEYHYQRYMSWQQAMQEHCKLASQRPDLYVPDDLEDF